MADALIGALVALVGAALGGGATFLVGRQQRLHERELAQQRDQRDDRLRAEGRRFDAYAAYLSRSRAFRNVAIACVERLDHPLRAAPGASVSLADVEEAYRSLNDASALVFLVSGSEATAAATRHILRAAGPLVAAVRDGEGVGSPRWVEVNRAFREAHHEFERAARRELGSADGTRPSAEGSRPAPR